MNNLLIQSVLRPSSQKMNSWVQNLLRIDIRFAAWQGQVDDLLRQSECNFSD